MSKILNWHHNLLSDIKYVWNLTFLTHPSMRKKIPWKIPRKQAHFQNQVEILISKNFASELFEVFKIPSESESFKTG